jgi:hypothetical protein
VSGRATGKAGTLRRLGAPVPAAVEAGGDGVPVRVDGRAVEAVLERWVVEEGWWNDLPARRRYAELVLEGGRVAVVYEDMVLGGWLRQVG